MALDVEFVADTDLLIALAGAEASLRVGGIDRPNEQPVSVRAGESIEVRRITGGLRAYLAVGGSLDVPRLLGSCAPDSVLGFGGRLVAGQRIPINRATPPIVNEHFGAELYRLNVPTRPDAMTVDATDGPDIADFADTAARLYDEPYVVSPTSNHIGLRMTGVLPERQVQGEVLSRGVPVGAVEVPPGTELLVLHRGRGVTAGYPVLAVVTTTSLDVLAQARPGQTLRFRRVSEARASEQARAERAALDALRLRVQSAFTALDAFTTSSGRTPS
jgi:allophanate hydrolase subunit 2